MDVQDVFEHKIIFGRIEETEEFKQILKEAERMGLAVLTIGQKGMGKSALLRKFAQEAEGSKDYRCTVLEFELGQDDDAGSWFERIKIETHKKYMDDDIASRVVGPRTGERFRSLLSVLKLEDAYDAFLKKSGVPVWEDFLSFLNNLSSKLDGNQRLVMLIDPINLAIQ